MIKLSEYKQLLRSIEEVISKDKDFITLYKDALDVFPEKPLFLTWQGAYYHGIGARELLRKLFPNNKPKPRRPLTLEELEAFLAASMINLERERQLAISATRLTPDNRLQATLRAPTYKKDFEFISGLPIEEQAEFYKKLESKWKIPFLPDPKSPLSQYSRVPLLYTHPTDTPGFLNVSINLAASKTDLMDAVDKLLDKHLSPDRARKSKNRLKYAPNLWDVYDLKESEGKTLADIARRISGIDGDVNDNPTLNKTYQSVEYAYGLAEKMIERVEAEAGPPFNSWSLICKVIT